MVLFHAPQALASLDAISRAALTAATSAPELAANPAAFQALLDPLPSPGTCSSVLHISHYQPSVAATPANLEHVDQGMLTIVSDDATGLEVSKTSGSRVLDAITPCRSCVMTALVVPAATQIMRCMPSDDWLVVSSSNPYIALHCVLSLVVATLCAGKGP